MTTDAHEDLDPVRVAREAVDARPDSRLELGIGYHAAIAIAEWGARAMKAACEAAGAQWTPDRGWIGDGAGSCVVFHSTPGPCVNYRGDGTGAVFLYPPSPLSALEGGGGQEESKGCVISSRELIKRCGGDPDAPFDVGTFPPDMREPSPLLAPTPAPGQHAGMVERAPVRSPAPMVDNDTDDLIETLQAGVQSCGMHDDGSTELYHIEDANDAMAEAAARISRLTLERDASRTAHGITQSRLETESPLAVIAREMREGTAVFVSPPKPAAQDAEPIGYRYRHPGEGWDFAHIGSAIAKGDFPTLEVEPVYSAAAITALEADNKAKDARIAELERGDEQRVRDLTKYIDRADTAETELAALRDEVERKDAALHWYAEQARLCRLIHSGGDAGRRELSADGGAKARAALATAKEG